MVALQDDPTAARGLLGGTGLPVLMDDSGEIAAAYGVSAIPAHAFIDPTGARPTLETGGLSAEAALDRLESLK